jgi:hypothetical protein
MKVSSGKQQDGMLLLRIEWNDAGDMLNLKFRLEMFINQALDPREERDL